MVYSLITCPNQQRLPKKMEQEKKIRREIANSNERRRMQSINAGFNSLRTMLPKHDNEKLSKAAILQHTAEYIDQLEQDKTRFLQEIRDIKKLLNPELLELHQKSLQEQESKLINKQPFKRIKLEVNNSLDLSNSESSDEGIQLGNLSPKQENRQQLMNQQQVNGNSIQSIEMESAVLTSSNGCTTNSSNQLINGNDAAIESDDIDVLRAELVQVRKVLDRERKLRMQLEEQVRELEAQLYPTRIKEIAQQVQMQFQTTGVNVYQPQINYQQIKEGDGTEAIMIDSQHELVAQTVEIGAEIEALDCTEYSNQPTILSSSTHPDYNSHLITLSNKASNVNMPSTATFHIIQDLSTNHLIDSTNLTANLTNSLPEKVNETFNEASNKILTSTAYLTATTVSSNTPNKSKSKSSIHKTEKNANSTVSSTNASSQNNKIPTANKKSLSITALPNQQSSSQTNQLEAGKKEKAKKSIKSNQPAAIALPIDAPFIFNPTNQTNDETTASKLIDQSSTPCTTKTLTLQIIDSSLVSTIDKFDNVPTVITTTTAGRNNNLDTILEAICHLEGDSFYDKELNEQATKQMKSNLTVVNADALVKADSDASARPGVIVSSSNT